jgi:rhodanese-related sulfurtransferase
VGNDLADHEGQNLLYPDRYGETLYEGCRVQNGKACCGADVRVNRLELPKDAPHASHMGMVSQCVKGGIHGNFSCCALVPASRYHGAMAHQHSPRFLEIVDDAKKRIRETTVDDVKRRLDGGEQFLLIDVREDNEWEKDHLPRAIHLGKGVIERDIEQRVPDLNAPIVLYCGGGFRSALAADNLGKMGYSNVISMDGGIREWRAKGYRLARD